VDATISQRFLLHKKMPSNIDDQIEEDFAAHSRTFLTLEALRKSPGYTRRCWVQYQDIFLFEFAPRMDAMAEKYGACPVRIGRDMDKYQPVQLEVWRSDSDVLLYVVEISCEGAVHSSSFHITFSKAVYGDDDDKCEELLRLDKFDSLEFKNAHGEGYFQQGTTFGDVGRATADVLFSKVNKDFFLID
jgi:hypothetical protein